MELSDFRAEQRFLGVGVKVRHDVRAQARHEPAVAAAVSALLAPEERHIEARLAALRARLPRSPFWRARLVRAGLAAADLRTLADLAALPPLSRDEHAAAWRDLYVSDDDPELHLATTSGSSGQALLVVRSGFDGVYMWAAIRFWLAHLRLELPRRPRLALFCSLPGGLEYSARAPLFHGGAVHRVSALHGLARLRRTHAAVLSSDPAGLHLLAGQAHGLHPRLVLSSAQHLAPALRARAEASLGAPVLNYYATTELGPIAWECLRAPGRFHPLAPDVFVESLDGELVVTRLRDSALPLLRYRTGDRGTLDPTPCVCGRAPSIVGFAGREPCWLRRPDGERVDAWALAWLFKDIPLARFRLVQRGDDDFELVLADEPAIPAELLVERLRRVLRRMGWEEVSVRLRRDELPATGKPAPFLSLRA